jgi:ABC-type antimicrobial peptide transport system permease subunit
MLDKVLATIALASLIVFVGVLITYIDEIDLTIVSVVVLIMAAYDFFLLNRARPKPENGAAQQQSRP